MKNLFGTLQLIVLGIIVVLVVVSCCEFPFIPNIASYCVEIGHPVPGVARSRTYVEWKNKGDFDNALQQVRHHNGKVCLCVVVPTGTPHPHELNNDCSRYEDNCPAPENIRIVKITKSKDADKIAAGDSAANDPHVTYRVQSPYPGDIAKVLGTLKSVP